MSRAHIPVVVLLPYLFRKFARAICSFTGSLFLSIGDGGRSLAHIFTSEVIGLFLGTSSGVYGLGYTTSPTPSVF